MFILYTIYIGFTVTAYEHSNEMRIVSICISSGVMLLAFLEWIGSGFDVKVIMTKLGYIIFLVLIIASVSLNNRDTEFGSFARAIALMILTIIGSSAADKVMILTMLTILQI